MAVCVGRAAGRQSTGERPRLEAWGIADELKLVPRGAGGTELENFDDIARPFYADQHAKQLINYLPSLGRQSGAGLAKRFSPLSGVSR